MIKKILFVIFLVCAFSFRTNEEKKLKVELTYQAWQKHFNKLSIIRQYIDNSNLPHGDVKFMTGAIDSLMMDLVGQLNPQLTDTTKKKK